MRSLDGFEREKIEKWNEKDLFFFWAAEFGERKPGWLAFFVQKLKQKIYRKYPDNQARNGGKRDAV